MIELKDKNGIQILHDDVVYDNKDYYRVCDKKNELYLLSCTNGYIHNITQEIMNDFLRIGTYLENKHLFECD